MRKPVTPIHFIPQKIVILNIKNFDNDEFPSTQLLSTSPLRVVLNE